MAETLSLAGGQLFALLIEFVDPERLQEVVARHLEWLTARFADGTFIVSGPLLAADGAGGQALALLRATDFDEAKKIVASDPLVFHGAVRVTIKAFNPRMHTHAFDAIFQGPESRSITPA